jgi:hypothetical protein
MPDVRTVEFNSLPKSVRERFAAITIGTGGPAPLLSERTSTGTKIFGLSFLAVVLAILVVAMVGAGIGSLWNDLASMARFTCSSATSRWCSCSLS